MREIFLTTSSHIAVESPYSFAGGLSRGIRRLPFSDGYESAHGHDVLLEPNNADSRRTENSVATHGSHLPKPMCRRNWRALEDDLRTLIASGFDAEIVKLLTEEAPLAALCQVGADSESAGSAHCEGSTPRTSYLAKPLLTGSDCQPPSAAGGESIEIREQPQFPMTGACSNNGRPHDVIGSGPDDTNRPLQLDTSTAPLPSPFDGNESNKPSVKFTELIRDLLRGAPKRFKELYPMIAERQPKDRPVHGNKVSLASMGWLQEIRSNLQEVAVNRDGLWHLKEEIPSPVPVWPIERNREVATQAPSQSLTGKEKLGPHISSELRGIFE